MVGDYEPGNRDDVPVTSEVTTAMPQVPAQDGRPAEQRAPFTPTLPPGVALLVVTHGPNAGARFLLDLDVITAGRSVDSDIFLDDVTVSRQHAEFRAGQRRLRHRRPGQPQRHLCQRRTGQ